MKLSIVRVSRRPAWPAWSVALVGGWLGIIAVATWLSARTGREVTLCFFKLVTGKPCATCGSTRGVLAMLAGNVGQAFSYNPMVFTIFSIAALMLAVRLTLGRAVRVEMSRGESRITWVLAGGAFAANWAYVLLRVG